MNEIKILSGHISPETAYLVDDYPYGFRLRCKIRYWLQYAPKKGVRFWSQTTNPKRGHAWNKPKASTFQRFGGAMFLNDKGHVTWVGVNEYDDANDMQVFDKTFGAGLPSDAREAFDVVLAMKVKYEAKRAQGVPMAESAARAVVEIVQA